MLIKVTPEQIIKIGGPATNKQLATELANFISTQGDKFFLDTPRRIAEFLGQTAAESGGFTRFVESLNYSAARLMQVWPKHFPNLTFAKQYQYNERKLGNYIYGVKLAAALGNRPNTEDGYNFRGRALKQLTGYDNVNRFNKWVHSIYPNAPDFVKDPDKLLEYPWMILSAVWFWVTKKVYTYADKDDTLGATKAINGGTNGLADRQLYVNKAKKIIVNIPNVTPSKPVEVKPKQPDPILKEYQGKLNEIAKYKNDSNFNVGKVDGWHGPKTAAAIAYFQASTGYLTATATLDSATKEAIDNILFIIQTGKNTTVQEDLESITTSAPVVEEIPVDIPQPLITSVEKPISKSTTLWATLSSFSAFFVVLYEKGTAFFLQLDPIVQIAVLALLCIAAFFVVKAIRNRIKNKESLDKVLNKIEEIKNL